jgi:hypothetical protein
MTESTPYRQQSDSRGHKFLRIGSEVTAAGLVAVNWFATQLAARTMYYPVFLDGRIVAHIYQPFAWFWWQHRWPQNALRIGNRLVYLAPLWRTCEHTVLCSMLVLGGVGALCSLFLVPRRRTADLHGSAAWAGTTEIVEAKLL